jgi:starch-binding outer membrane protein, SusD/RagB family
MKKILYIFLSLTATLLIVVSCSKDYLNTFPTDQIGSEKALETTANAMASLNGIHRQMYSQWANQGEAGEGSMNINRDMLGEDLVMTASGNGWYNTTYQWIAHRSETNATAYYPWRMYYRFIANANLIINSIDNATGDPALKNAIKGEALCYRAWSHFQLVQLYGKRYDAAAVPNSQLGVPIMLTNTYDGLARSTVEEVYTQINKDLDDAITNLTDYKRANRSHFNVAVAKGIKARVALTMQNWSAAATLAKEARLGQDLGTGTTFSLMTNTEYKAGFNSYTNREWLWGSTVISDQTTYFYSYFAYMSRNFSSTNIRGNPKAIWQGLYNNAIFTATDVRKANFDPSGQHTSLGLGAEFTRKPYTSQKYLAAGGADSRGDVSYMRVAELLLIEAEAYARMGGNDALAQAALNTLRQNRETVPANYVASTKTGAALIDEIMLNRRLELWGEGFRYTDLKRLNLPLTRATATVTGGGNHSLALCIESNIPAGDVRWEWLIPKQELDANKLMVQNPL